MAITRDEYVRIVALLSEAYPSDLDSYLDKDRQLCCRLHGESIPSFVPVGGCADEKKGVHPAISAFHERGLVVCHAFPGQLALDRRVARFLRDGDQNFFNDSWARTSFFRDKYMRGNFANHSLYGAGYCYLRLMETTVRSRLARIFGPVPLVADVCRAYIHFGYVKGNRVSIKLVSKGFFHVVNSSTFRDADVICRALMDIVKEDPFARIGLDVNADSPSWVRQPGGFYPSCGFSSVAVRNLIGDDQVRRRGLVSWFSSKGIELSASVIDQLMIATTASASLTGANITVAKRVVKVWAICGDVEMKRVAVHGTASAVLSPSDYTRMLDFQTNQHLARVMVISGLRGCCDVGPLSPTSSVNATMFEAIVGVLTLFAGQDIMFQFLVLSGIVSAGVADPEVELSELDSVSVTMNSRQYANAVRMLREGKLG